MAVKKGKPKDKPLTLKQKCFVEEYLVDFNGRQAVVRAGIKTKNPDQMAYQWLQLPSVSKAIEQGLRFRLASARLSSEMLIEELARIARSDITRIAEWGKGGLRLRDSKTLGIADSACIQEISRDKRGGIKIKLHSKMDAIRTLMEYMGITTPDASMPTEDSPDSIGFIIQPKVEDEAS